MKEDCYDRYFTLERSRQIKQINNIKSIINPHALLAYSSSFVPNKWVSDNWKYCSNKSEFFDPADAANQFSKLSDILSFGLNKESYLVVEANISKRLISEDSVFSELSSLFEDTQQNIDDAIKYTSSSLPPVSTPELSIIDELISNAVQNYHDNLTKYNLKPEFSIQIICEGIRPIYLSSAHNKCEHKLDIFMSKDLLISVLLGKVHWDSLMLSFLLDYKRAPDYYCSETYYSLYSFTSSH